MNKHMETIEKDMAAAKDLAEKAAKTTEDMLNTALDHAASILTGDKMTVASEKAYAEDMAQKIASFGDVVQEAVEERFGDKLERANEYFTADVRAEVEAAQRNRK